MAARLPRRETRGLSMVGRSSTGKLFPVAFLTPSLAGSCGGAITICVSGAAPAISAPEIEISQ
jgi:hypothetical protein